MKNVDDFGIFSNDPFADISANYTQTLKGATAAYDLSGSSQFGYSIALNASGTIMAVGAPQNNSGNGAVVIFQWNGSAWAQMGATLIGTPTA